jgi:hypothetical protein
MAGTEGAPTIGLPGSDRPVSIGAVTSACWKTKNATNQQHSLISQLLGGALLKASISLGSDRALMGRGGVQQPE